MKLVLFIPRLLHAWATGLFVARTTPLQARPAVPVYQVNIQNPRTSTQSHVLKTLRHLRK